MKREDKRGERGAERPRKTGLVIAGLLTLPLLLSPSSTASPIPSPASGETVVAEVNGERISRTEFQARMPDYRGDVLNTISGSPGCDAGAAEFWKTPCDGKVPLETLKARTLEALIRIKVQQAAAKEAGLVQDTGYDSLLATLKEVNRQRQARAGRGEVIYGPRQYSEKTFYAYMLANQALELREHLAAKEGGGQETINGEQYARWLDRRVAAARVTLYFQEYDRLELLP